MKGVGNAISLVCFGVAAALIVPRLASINLPSPAPDSPQFEPSLTEKAAVESIRTAQMEPQKRARLAALYIRLADYIEAGELESTGQLRAFQSAAGRRIFEGYGSTPGLSDSEDALGAISKALVKIGDIPLDDKGLPKAIPLDDRRDDLVRACRSIAWAARHPKKN